MNEKTAEQIDAASILPIPPVAPHLQGMRLVIAARQGMLKLYEDLRDQGGPVTPIKYGKHTNLFVNDATAIDHVLRNTNYEKGGIAEFLYPLIGKGQLLNKGDLWKAQKDEAMPAFHKRLYDDMAKEMARATNDTLDRWEQKARQGKPVNLAEEFPRLTFDILMRALFHEPGFDKAGLMQTGLGTVLNHSNRRLVNPFKLNREFVYKLPPFKGARKALYDAAQELITRRRAVPEDQRPDDLLTTLSQEPKEGSLFSPNERRQQILTYLLAGHETTAHSMTFALKLLTQNPAAMKKLTQEVDSTIGKSVPTREDIHKMPYTEAVFQETLRCYPSVAAVPRQAVEADRLPLDDGRVMEIPRKQMIIISAWSLHHDPKYWENPGTFNPDTFASGVTHKKGSYIPFSIGQRACIGMPFAKLEASIILAMIAQRFEVTVREPEKIQAEPTITLRPDRDVWADLKLRNAGPR